MSSTESFDDLEQRIRTLVEDSLREVKDELDARLLTVRERLDEIVNSEMVTARQEAAAASERAGAMESAAAQAEEARAALVAEAEEAKIAALAEAEEAHITALEEAEAAGREAATIAVADAFQSVLRAAIDIDSARSQVDILHALVFGSGRFAARTALFLTREDGLQGWAGPSFDLSDEQFRQLHLDYAEDSLWSQVAQGRGTVSLDTEDCSEFCRSVDESRPRAGVLIPLVLRDRLAAALYADRGDDGDLQVAALQLLTYIAAQALETLPLRGRPATPTLRLLAEAPTEETGLEFWQFVIPPAPEEMEVEEAVEHEAPAEVVGFEESTAEPLTEAWEAPEEIADLQPAEESGFAMEEVAPEIEIDEAVAVVEAEEDVIPEAAEEAWEMPTEPTLEAEPEAAVGLAPEPAAEAWEMPTEPTLEAEPEAAEELAPEPAAEITAEPTEAAAEEILEPMPAAAPPPTVVEPPTEVTPAAPIAAGGAEVAPPEDVDGPGWAFTTRRFSAAEGESAAHEEARRLARLLVTEIKLYNEEQVEEGRRGRNIYRSLQEDIDRSRQIYEERIDEGVREGTDYFQDELVRILAAGDADALGT